MFIQGVLCFIAVFACVFVASWIFSFKRKPDFWKKCSLGKHKKFFPEAKSQSGSPQAENAVWIEKKAVIKS